MNKIIIISNLLYSSTVTYWDYVGSPVVKTLCFPCRSQRVNSWLGELSSHIPCGVEKKVTYYSPIIQLFIYPEKKSANMHQEMHIRMFMELELMLTKNNLSIHVQKNQLV